MKTLFEESGEYESPTDNIEKIKEYLFNTANFENKEDPFFISELYLKQTLKFLETLNKK